MVIIHVSSAMTRHKMNAFTKKEECKNCHIAIAGLPLNSLFGRFVVPRKSADAFDLSGDDAAQHGEADGLDGHIVRPIG